ncbi:hypothetical protein HT576_08800 [Haloterrigena sp. SYSU A121-1]|uniref:Uncharacterized protein n=1 Tax=Haloterrigena gelatinilytica TaxID=2741724 RepID=A0A8J8GJF3_9EURY|nr:hypothetical protein [Haloterrigena gelatinilytica]NUB91118.1 hypothetical protein [Haloterrigena gelatinilytica]
MLEEVQQWIDDSQYENWEVYFLIWAAFISLCIYAEFRPVTGMLRSLDTTTVGYGMTLGEVFIAALQGVIVGIFGWKLFSQGDTYFAVGNSSFDTKETAFLVKIGVMTLVGIVFGLVIPQVVETHAEYVVIQTGGAVILLGYALIHVEIRNWKLLNELPVLLAGLLLVYVPHFS